MRVVRLPFTRPVFALMLFAVVAGCGADVTGTGPAQGIYELRRLNGEQVPYDHQGLGCCTYLSGTLRLEAGSYTAAIRARNRNTGVVFTATEWGKYASSASELTFALDSFDVEPLGFDAGTISADSVRVAFGGEGPGSPDQFHAIFVRGD